jgi:hypothetical protein
LKPCERDTSSQVRRLSARFCWVLRRVLLLVNVVAGVGATHFVAVK